MIRFKSRSGKFKKAVCIYFLIIFIISGLGLSCGFALDDSPDQTGFALTESEAAYIGSIQNETVTLGYTQPIEYNVISGEECGKLLGIIKFLRDDIGLRVQMKQSDFSSEITKPEEEQADLFGLINESSRTKEYYKTKPIAKTNVYVLTNALHPIVSLENLANKRIAVSGEKNSYIYEKVLPFTLNSKLIFYQNLDAALSDLYNNRVDAFMTTFDLAHQVYLSNNIEYEFTLSSNNVNGFIGSTKEKYKPLIDIISRYISREKFNIIEKTEEARVDYLLKLAKSEIDQSKTEGIKSIKAFIDTDLYPYSYLDTDGQIKGTVVDIYRCFEAISGIDIEFVTADEHIKNQKESIKKLALNEIQVVSQSSDNYFLEENCSYSRITFQSNFVTFTNFESSDKFSKDLDDAKIGTVYYANEYISALVENDANIKVYDTRDDVLKALNAGEIDCAFLNKMNYEYHFIVQNDILYRPNYEIEIPVSLYMLFNNENAELNNMLNNSINLYSCINPSYKNSFKNETFSYKSNYVKTYHQQKSLYRFAVTVFSICICTITLVLMIAFILYFKYREYDLQTRKLLEGHTKFDIIIIDLKRKKVSSMNRFRTLRQWLPQADEVNFEQFDRVERSGTFKKYSELYAKLLKEKTGDNRIPVKDKLFFSDLNTSEKNGKIFWHSTYGYFINKSKAIISIMDITEQKMREIELKNMIGTDILTGLYDRHIFRLKIKEAIDGKRNRKAMLVIFNLNRFKEYNEKLGYSIGDRMLVEFAFRLKENFFAPNMFLFRISGDEFSLLANDLDDEKIVEIEDKIKQLEVSIQINGTFFNIYFNSGYAVWPDDEISIDRLIEKASFALNLIEKNDANVISNRIVKHDNALYFSHKSLMTLLSEFDVLLKKRQIMTVFQPIIDMKTGRIYGYEALSRPKNKSFRNILQVLEISHMKNSVFELNKIMIESAIKSFIEQEYSGIKLFLNVDFGKFEDSESIRKIEDLIYSYNITENLVIEITERYNITEYTILENILTRFKLRGGIVALDDYGAGYSNEASLVRIQPSIVKLDYGVIHNVDKEEYKQMFIKQFVAFAKQTGTLVLAEGVETESECNVLKELGVDYAQGYHLGKPAAF